MKWYKIMTAVTTCLLAITAIALCLSIYFGYSGSGDIYTPEIIGDKLAVLMWPALIWLVSLVLAFIFEARDGGKKPEKPEKTEYKKQTSNKKAVLAARIAVAIIALALFIFGIANGGMRDVLVKAINICSECIGLG